MLNALPYTSKSSLSGPVIFRFVAFSPTLLNSAFVDPDDLPLFRVCTDASSSGVSTLQTAQGANIAFIEWGKHPQVGIRGLLPKQATAQWLALSPDRTYVILTPCPRVMC
jgi:hypothetical protein